MGLSSLEHTAIGAVAGWAEVTVMQARLLASQDTVQCCMLLYTGTQPSFRMRLNLRLGAQPTVAIKNAMQEGRPVSWNPVALYRGYGVRICCGCLPCWCFVQRQASA